MRDIVGLVPSGPHDRSAVALGEGFVDVRVVVAGNGGTPRCTTKGLTIKPDSLPVLIELLRRAHGKAIAAGLCQAEA
jgi:hypothetical protein